MIVIQRSTFQNKLARAEMALTQKGVLATDGTGDEEVESVITLLRFLLNKQLMITHG